MTLTNVLSSTTIGKPTTAKVHLTDQVETIIPFRSTAHLPPTAAQPHVAPHKKQLQKQAARAAAASASASGSESSLDAKAKKSPGGGVKAKASTKQKKRNSKALERGAEFAEKLEFKAKEFEGRKPRAPPFASPSLEERDSTLTWYWFFDLGAHTVFSLRLSLNVLSSPCTQLARLPRTLGKSFLSPGWERGGVFQQYS
ncbi:hypothetical protein BDY24DRAFT_371974 [Mrakia frigida]|uniref:uncharacterized protein n=1 Tax=Mrakia frigida TaxID=29902 RepID=UPI003FCC0402